MAVELCPLFSLEKQFQAKNGANNTNGFLKVFLAGTDDPATTYSDYVGTLNPQKIVLDDNGRAVVICDKAKAYRLEVYDADGMLLWTEEPKYCTGNGGGGVSTTRVISTDGSISVGESVVGSQRTYDIGIAPSDSDEFLEWAKCIDEDVPNGVIYPTFVDGTMETEAGKGLHVGKDRFYHLTMSFRVYPSGTGINYESLTTELKFNNGETTSLLIRRTYDIDNSLHDSVMCEFSYDFKAPADGYLFFQLDNVTTFHDVAVVMQIHRIYSGINAVPGTCATKQWVQETFDYNMSEKISYSALGYNSNGEISGISGSAIYGGIDAAAVSSIASSYAESAISSISGWSGDFSSISSKIDWSSSGVFQPSGNYQAAGDYAYNSSLSSKVDQSAFDDCCSAVHSALDDKLDKSSSGLFQLSGDYAYNSSLSSYIPASSSGMFAPSGDYQSAGDYAFNSAVSSKLDASASGDFVLNSSFSSYSSDVTNNITNISSVVSSKADSSALSSYQPVSAMSSYATESYVDSAVSGKLDVTASSQFLTSLPDDLAYTSDVASAVSGKMDKSESSSFYPMDSNPSGYLTAHQSLAGLATEQYVDSAVSSKLDASAYDSAWFQPASSMSAWIPYSALDYSGTAISGIGGSSLAGMGVEGHTYTGINPVVVDNVNDTISVEHRTLCVDSTMNAYNSGSSAVLGVNTAQFAPSGDYIQESALGWVEV